MRRRRSMTAQTAFDNAEDEAAMSRGRGHDGRNRSEAVCGDR